MTVKENQRIRLAHFFEIRSKKTKDKKEVNQHARSKVHELQDCYGVHGYS